MQQGLDDGAEDVEDGGEEGGEGVYYTGHGCCGWVWVFGVLFWVVAVKAGFDFNLAGLLGEERREKVGLV